MASKMVVQKCHPKMAVPKGHLARWLFFSAGTSSLRLSVPTERARDALGPFSVRLLWLCRLPYAQSRCSFDDLREASRSTPPFVFPQTVSFAERSHLSLTLLFTILPSLQQLAGLVVTRSRKAGSGRRFSGIAPGFERLARGSAFASSLQADCARSARKSVKILQTARKRDTILQTVRKWDRILQDARKWERNLQAARM